MKLWNHYEEKLEIMRNILLDISKPNILELGVQKGISTKVFLDVCEKNNGYLTSIDIDDCSNVSSSDRWKFIHSSDDDFDNIDKKLKEKNSFDFLFVDSLHEPSHVRKVFYHYFNYIKIGGFIVVDDVVWLPYIKGGIIDREFSERINRLTFNKILEIYNSNRDVLSLDINFSGSGLAILKKKGSLLKKEQKIKNRLYNLKNLIKNFYAPKPKK